MGGGEGRPARNMNPEAGRESEFGVYLQTGQENRVGQAGRQRCGDRVGEGVLRLRLVSGRLAVPGWH